MRDRNGCVVLPKFPGISVRDLDMLISTAGITLVPVDAKQVRIARDAFRRYGKGRHPAGLNFGDCFSYALAKLTRQPLLFKGDDFSLNDIASIG